MVATADAMPGREIGAADPDGDAFVQRCVAWRKGSGNCVSLSRPF